jgi:hypothetical protein
MSYAAVGIFTTAALVALAVLYIRRRIGRSSQAGNWQFGLVPILLVLVTIAILSSILFPVFNQAKDVPSPIWNDVIAQTPFFVSMIVGTLAKSLWDWLNLTPPRPKFDLGTAALPLVISPLLFSFMVGQDLKLSLGSLLLAFQSGYFWKTIFQQVSEQTGKGTQQ